MIGDGIPGANGGSSVDTRFDASQYAFFGKDVVEEVELGGLEDDDDGHNAGLAGLDEDDYRFSAFGDKEEGEGLGSFSDIDDIASTFSKLNTVVSEPRSTGGIGNRGSFSRESSSASEWVHEPDLSNWVDQHILDAEHVQDGKRWWSQPHPSPDNHADSKSLSRTSSYPQQQQQQHGPSKPLLVPKSSLTSYPPPSGLSHSSPNHSLYANISAPSSGPHMPFSPPNFPPIPGSQFHVAGFPHGLHSSGSTPNFYPHTLSSRQQNHRLPKGGFLTGDNSNLLPPIPQQQAPHSNDLMPPRLLSQQQHHRLPSFQPSLPHFSHLQPQLLGPHSSPPQMMNNFEAMHGMADFRDQRMRQTQKGRPNLRFPQQGFDTSSQKNGNWWPQFQSKYMSAEEIESIMRMQHAATHSNDPYVDDYYHQACLAKRPTSSRLTHHFCPSSIRDPSSRARANNEPHAYLQIDALGRIPFSSVRRPRPLLEVDPPSASDDNSLDQKSSVRPLEQEPMLAARITIEDGLSILLDVDDIDRLFKFSQPQDGGSQLKRRRQVLLEELATSFQLVDPLEPSKAGHSVGIAPKDDLVFLRLVSLPKGRKLLSRYLQLLFPGSELIRIVCMAIFRHLRFLFGGLLLDFDATEITTDLSRTVSSCVRGMDLSVLSACLAAIVCSPEQPPLRPLGSSAGDGASVILKSVLERATELLSDHNSASNYSIANRALWQASFDAFFALLTQYCLSKYDGVIQSLNMESPSSVTIDSEATKAISREMPVELLRASLPHTNEQQRKMLLDFAQKSMPVSGYVAHGNGSGTIATESVPS